jgi:hypothetical protein
LLYYAEEKVAYSDCMVSAASGMTAYFTTQYYVPY